jgi:hypothetical protein
MKRYLYSALLVVCLLGVLPLFVTIGALGPDIHVNDHYFVARVASGSFSS